jgi:ATP/maltotriose-dependent transcriptional regulator MalT
VLWAGRGLSNRQIVARLRVAGATVKRHLANIYKKLGVSSRNEAVAKGLSEGWITSVDITRGGESS